MRTVPSGRRSRRMKSVKISRILSHPLIRDSADDRDYLPRSRPVAYHAADMFGCCSAALMLRGTLRVRSGCVMSRERGRRYGDERDDGLHPRRVDDATVL